MMKKIAFLLFALGLLFTSCSKDDSLIPVEDTYEIDTRPYDLNTRGGQGNGNG